MPPSAAAAAYDPWFLGTPGPLPRVPAEVRTVTLPFTHLTVVLQADRRLPLATAANLDGARLLDLERGDDWHLDRRVPADQETGPEVPDVRAAAGRAHRARLGDDDPPYCGTRIPRRS